MVQATEATQQPIQQELAFAYVKGERVVKPEDLFIPPEALEVILESFEGPLDLLLYLIKKQKFEILDLPIFQITEQYMSYVEVMKVVNLELAAEYLVMAAMLAEIKSKLLLPKIHIETDDETDPRVELIKRLKEYEVFKNAAHEIDQIPREERDFFSVTTHIPAQAKKLETETHVDLNDLVLAFSQVLKRVDNFKHHQIQAEALSTRERMSKILAQLDDINYIAFNDFFTVSEGRAGAVVTFLAILELVKEQLVILNQNQSFADIFIKKTSGDSTWFNPNIETI
ncbi:segregation and condensation protein A [Catenovulum maritimum]|uniref:Segregation and condensation protein A n=2 Tax=Catenovulum maritimum TaxID=1513271 RepID=A0A0J8GVN7_9ALTE|nr:ScpA family protein [Catenovulum maritimum]KMT65374.1 segregation and condensation protein A [Catenovulum maritimum]